MIEKGIAKKLGDHLRKKEIPKKDESYPEVQQEKRDLHRSRTTVNSPITANNPSQNISNPIPQKQFRAQMDNIPKLANNNLIQPQSGETNTGGRGGDGDSNNVLKRSQWERRLLECLEDYETWFDEYRNDV